MKFRLLIIPFCIAFCGLYSALFQRYLETNPKWEEVTELISNFDSLNELKIKQSLSDSILLTVFDQEYDKPRPILKLDNATVHHVEVAHIRVKNATKAELAAIMSAIKIVKDRDLPINRSNLSDQSLREIPVEGFGLYGRYASNCYWKLGFRREGRKLQVCQITVGYH